jgi:hypothetical protein
MVRRPRHLSCRTRSWAWVSNGLFGILYGINGGDELPNSSPCYSNLQRARTETSFFATDLEARPSPLTVMASGVNRGKRPWGGSPTIMVLNHRTVERGQTLPPAVPRRRPGGVLLCVGDCLGLFPTVVLILAC